MQVQEARAAEATGLRLTFDERTVVWLLWLTYGAFYFCRTNLSVVLPSLEKDAALGGLGLTSIQTGLIAGSLKITYGLGQLINGQLAERISPRRILALGMLGSAALNVAFGFGTGFYFLLFVWATNGYFQSMGWPPTVRIMGNWVPVARRGKAMGIIGTGYQITLGLTYFVAGQSAELLGWRAALYVPAALLAGVAVIMLFFLKDSPEDREAAPHAAMKDVSPKERPPLLQTLAITLANPALWLLGISLGLLNACRYGFVDWGVSHLVEVQNTGVGKAGLKYVVLAAGAAAGSYCAGWISDRFFGSRRAPVICILLLALSGLTLLYEAVADVSATGTMVLLAAIGFCIFGPQVLLVGTAPADLARRGATAAAAGFVDFMGYVGAAIGDSVTGYYKMPEHGGWQVAIYIWACWAFAAAVFAACLWNARGKAEAIK